MNAELAVEEKEIVLKKPLYSISIIVKEFQDYKDVRMIFFKNHKTFNYRKYVGKRKCGGYTREYIEELFTIDESFEVIKWIDHHRGESIENITIERINSFPENIMPTGGIPVGGRFTDFLM